MRRLVVVAALATALACGAAAQPRPNFTLDQALSYPFVDSLVAAERADVIAWVVDLRGVRNIWSARGPEWRPRQLTHYAADDGQELTNLAFSPDGTRLVYVRGGDHDANWPAEGHLAPDPASAAETPAVTIWAAPLAGGEPVKLSDGDSPVISEKGQLAYIKDDQVWTAPLNPGGKAERLFFDRGKDSELRFSPDGSALAFVSNRGDHAFIGVFAGKDRPLTYLAPSTGRDGEPRWSPDGRSLAFTRQPGEGGPPEPILTEVAHPWSIWVADLAGGAHAVWRSPPTLAGSWPEVEGEANLSWAAGDRLVFLSEVDGWPHLYSVAVADGPPTLLTPGRYMVEHVVLSRDRRQVIFDANTGDAKDDDDRRHLFATPVNAAAAVPLTSGQGLEWKPVAASANDIAFVSAGIGAPPAVALAGLNPVDGGTRRQISAPATDFPFSAFIAPRNVAWTSPDGVVVHGQLFQRPGGAAAKPGVVFVHGGPPRQMLLGWHYMDYYSNAYAVNQYLAAHGFVVLSVNYRLGIGYGRAYQHPDHAGPAGAAEYQDVLSGARFLQGQAGVDPARIGIWGGSYGGYLTGLALGRNSDVFKAGADLHGVHDWSPLIARELHRHPGDRYEEGDLTQAMKTAFASSPDADVAGWTSPVILIQGDDDRNVDFHQTVDLARRLDAKGVPYEELVIPNEIHGFLRYESWLGADTATVEFLTRKLGASGD